MSKPQTAEHRALEQIARMRLLPDDQANRFTLLAAIQLAKDALGSDGRPEQPDALEGNR